MRGVVDELRVHRLTLGDAFVEPLLQRIGRESPHPDVRAASIFARAYGILERMALSPEEQARARELLDLLQRDYPGSSHDKWAEGYRRELAELQLGMTAPDFEAVDQDGKTFRLSDYRGKVVALAFWGFW